MKKTKVLGVGCLLMVGCVPHDAFERTGPRLVPAEEFSHSLREGKAEDFSIFRIKQQQEEQAARAKLGQTADGYNGDPRFLQQGYRLKGKFEMPQTMPVQAVTNSPAIQPQLSAPGLQRVSYPAGSMAPYQNGQMTANPSLWPDEGQGADLFRDVRAYQAMDVITIAIKENSQGKKKAETTAKGKFSLSAGIESLLGIETKDWAANNTALDPTSLIKAATDNDFKGTGETKREGSLTGNISAVIMEVLPNGVLRIEGTKIMSMNDEEEIMVLSGLVRPRDVDAQNQVDSSRIANMRIDFYGRGVLGEQQTPGWGARLFEYIWPF